MKKLCVFLTCILILVSFNLAAFAYDAVTTESESNNTYSTADSLTSEVTMRGALPAGDADDWYSVYISSGNTAYIQLSSIPSSCDWDVYLYNTNGTTLLQGSSNFNDIGECINYSITTSGTYYIKVHKSSGDSSSQYKLYVQVSGKSFTHSFYVENPTNSTYMTQLGRDAANNLSGLVFLSFGQGDKSGTDYGVWSFAGSHIAFSDVKTAVNNFIQGYLANPRHNQNIEIVVGINNYKGTSLSTTDDYKQVGANLKTCVAGISANSYVDAIYGGFDAEMSWNSPDNTKAVIDGYSGGTYKRIYNFGNHLGDTTDFSGQTDPAWTFTNWSWHASDCWYVSYSGPCFVTPEIYNTNDSLRWTWEKKWCGLHSKSLAFEGLLSTNGWSDSTGAWLYNQNSYNTFNSTLSTNGQGETLEYGTWFARRSQQ
jgi:hypothetical protein